MINQHSQNGIIRSFNRAAISYDKANFLQCDTGEQLFNLLPSHIFPDLIVDIGCGTGSFTAKLARTFPKAEVIGIDGADNMVKFAQECFSMRKNLKFWHQNADNLPLPDAATDLIFSNLMLQWSTDINVTLREWHRILRPSGHLLLSTVGDGSLQELTYAFEKIDSYSHINNFITEKQLLMTMNQTGFKNLQFSDKRICRTFAAIDDLMLELKMFGSHNITYNRPRGLSGKHKFKRLQTIYDAYRDCNNRLPLSFEIYYVQATK